MISYQLIIFQNSGYSKGTEQIWKKYQYKLFVYLEHWNQNKHHFCLTLAITKH